MTRKEFEFRAIERQLDELVEHDRPFLLKENIQITDASNRNGDRDGFLSWCYRFERQQGHCPEIARVTVWVTFQEPVHLPTPQEVNIWTRSEIFQIGQISRWQSTQETTLSLKTLQSQGLVLCHNLIFG